MYEEKKLIETRKKCNYSLIYVNFIVALEFIEYAMTECALPTFVGRLSIRFIFTESYGRACYLWIIV